MPIGPKHYEGWICKECVYFGFYPAQMFESKDTLKPYFCKKLYEHIDIMNTPSTCPYIRDAVVMHVRGETDEDYL